MRTTKNNDIKDLFISFIFSSEFLILFIKLISKFYKLIINITSINLGKVWEYRPLIFSLISTIKYSVKLLCEINFCYVLFKLGGTNIYYLIDIIKGVWHLLKLIQKIYDNYQSSIYINNLIDYKSEVSLEKIEKSRPEISKEEKEKIKNELSVICNICLYEIDEGKYLQCGHIFHIKCIKEWIIANSNCPICKSPIINKNGIHSKFYNQQLGINEPEKKVNEILKKFNFENETFIPKKNTEIDKYNYYKKLQKFLINNSNYDLNNKINEINPGSISYSLPCEALLDRGINNELKRIEIEFLNQKLMNIYQNPVEIITQFKLENDELK
jgi:E3 ubiquitin-protein ligase synoviolin